MSYYGGASNAVSFPSYGQHGVNQGQFTRNISGLASMPGQSQTLPHPHHNPSNHNRAHNKPVVIDNTGSTEVKANESLQGLTNDNISLSSSLQPLNSNADGRDIGGSQLPDPRSSPNDNKKKERKNRPGQRFGAKKKSWVWSWFTQDSLDPNLAVCDYCGKVIRRLASDKGSPKKLSEHLKTHKLDTHSINNTRAIPVDGNGMSYSPSGVPISYHNQFSHQSTPTAHIPPPPLNTINTTSTDNNPQHTNAHMGLSSNGHANSDPNDPNGHLNMSAPSNMFDKSKSKKFPVANSNFNFNNNIRRFLSPDFDNSPYTPQKFHRHILSFLIENKLSINVARSHSFQQLIYDLRSDSVAELQELTTLYGSLLEVSRFDGPQGSHPDNSSMATMDEANVVNSIVQAVEQKEQSNVN